MKMCSASVEPMPSRISNPYCSRTPWNIRAGSVSAGETLPARMFPGVREQYGFEILDGIGSTEALHIFISNVAGMVVPGSSGFPVPGYRVELRRADGTVIEGVDEPGM